LCAFLKEEQKYIKSMMQVMTTIDGVTRKVLQECEENMHRCQEVYPARKMIPIFCLYKATASINFKLGKYQTHFFYTEEQQQKFSFMFNSTGY